MINIDPPVELKTIAETENAYLALLKASTSTESIPTTFGSGFLGIGNKIVTTNFSLIYLSPQLIETAVHLEALKRGYGLDKEELLFLEVNKRLVSENTLAFILYIKTDNPNLTLSFSPVQDRVGLMTVNHTAKIAPSKFEPLFNQPLQTHGQPRWGYIFFPASQGCNNGVANDVIDISKEPSLSVQIDSMAFSYEVQPANATTQLSWNYNLAPMDMKLIDALSIIAPKPADPGSPVDWMVMLPYVGTVIEIMLNLSKFFR
jgi:hypothetical protein